MSQVVSGKPPLPAMPARNIRHFNQIPHGTHIIGSMADFAYFANYFKDFNRYRETRDEELHALWNRHSYNQKILSKFAINFEWYYQHVQKSDKQPYSLWNKQCDQQQPLLNLVLCELHKKHKINLKYMRYIFGELDLNHRSHVKPEFFGYSKGATTSLAVHAYVLFERFLAKFAGIGNEFSNQDGGSMCHWFEKIPTSVIKTNLEDVSEKARTFTKRIGVKNVVLAMCVFQAHKMYEELTLSAILMGRIIFHDFDRDPKTQVEAGCNFRLFETAFLEKMDWRLHVGTEEYIKNVRDLMCPEFPDLDIDCIQFDESRDKASAMLKMLQEASEVPDQKLCERPHLDFTSITSQI
jgi:hypothetical protein